MSWSAIKRKIVCLPQKFYASEILLLVISIILEITSSSFLYTTKKNCGGQCVLFAKLFERARILQGSSPSWCYLPMVFNLAATTSSVFVLKLIIKGRRSRSSNLRVLGLGSLSAFLVLLSSWIISSGFREFCKSFVINKCIHAHIKAMDWKNFTPKYTDGGDLYFILQLAEASGWSACLLLCVFCVTHARKLFAGLHTTKNLNFYDE